MGLKRLPNLLFLNKEWVEQLYDNDSYDVPESISELSKEDFVDGLTLKRSQFKDIISEFNRHDMNRNGKQDEIPLAFVSQNWQGNESDFIASFGVPENREHKTLVDGKVTFTFEDPRWYEGVKEIADWTNRGLILPSSFETGDSKFLANGQSGLYGSFYWWEKATVVPKDQIKDYIVLSPLTDEDGNSCVGLSNEQEIETGVCVISANCEDPEELLAYFDKFFLPKISAQLNYGSFDDGAFKPDTENGKYVPNDDHGNQTADDFRMKNAPYGVVYLGTETWEESVKMESRAELRYNLIQAYEDPHVPDNVDQFPNLNYSKEDLVTLNDVEGTLMSNINAWYQNVALGLEKPTESAWLKLLSDYRGYMETVRKINQEAYDKYIANIGA